MRPMIEVRLHQGRLSAATRLQHRYAGEGVQLQGLNPPLGIHARMCDGVAAGGKSQGLDCRAPSASQTQTEVPCR